jgi:hypothetical protein
MSRSANYYKLCIFNEIEVFVVTLPWSVLKLLMGGQFKADRILKTRFQQ